MVDRSRAGARVPLTLLCVAALVVGCTSNGASQVPSALESASPVAPMPSLMPVTSDLGINFESSNPLNELGILDVFAPEAAGPWPVVVMFHGNPATDSRTMMRTQAERLAGTGFVVFAPNWGKSGGPTYDALSFVEMGKLDNAQSACAVAFARARAADYGGDPSTMIVYGHSGGGNQASVQAFLEPAPTDGCLVDTDPGTFDALVVWEGDWVLWPPFWDAILAEEPGWFDLITPWTRLAEHRDLPVHFVVSENPGYGRQDGAWLDTRGDGQMRSRLTAVGALEDGYMGFDELEEMFAKVLEDQGYSVTYDVMPNSTHSSLGAEGWPVFLEAFKKAADAV